MEFLRNFAPIVLCSNLFSKLYEIREKLQNNSIFIFVVYKKGSKSNFLERNTFFFVNDVRFARKHFWAYSKLVGTPGTTLKERARGGWITFLFVPPSDLASGAKS